MAAVSEQPPGPAALHGTGENLSRRQWLILLAMAIALIAFWSSRITGSLIDKDAAETLRMALNLKQTGVISSSEQPPFGPSMFREPLPVITTALAVYGVEAVLGPADPSQYFSGERARLLKFQNVFWLGCLCVALCVFMRRLTPAFHLVVVGLMTTNVLLLYTEVGRYMLDSLYTEAPAAALLAIGSLFLSSAIVQRRVLLMLLAGVCFGLLALVKAAFLYIVPGIVILMPFATLVNRRQIPVIPLIRLAIVLVMAFFVVVAPWMYRNYLSLGTFSITSRGGEALYNRALLNQMTVEEYFGSLSLWAPYPLNGALRRILGISREDLENGVRLQRLGESADSKWAKADFAAELAGRPEDAHTFYRQVGAERVKLINEFRAAGHPEPELAADGVLRERAMQMISRHPLRHLANTFSNLWRGAFFSLPLLLIAMAYAWRHKHLELLMLIVPAVAMILFYGAVSAFTPRYALPAYPLAICSGVVLCGLLARRQAPQAASQ